MAQTVNSLPAMWERQVQSLGQEDPLEKGVATHSSILAWRIPWTEESGGLQSRFQERLSDLAAAARSNTQLIDKRIRIHAISACQPLEKHLSAT